MIEILNGKEVAKEIKDNVKLEVDKIINKKKPTLVVIRVDSGNKQSDLASMKYIKNKEIACNYTGITSITVSKKYETTQDELIKNIIELNKDENIDGIMVQQPLPPHIDEKVINNIIDKNKDVDGFNSFNLGQIVVGNDCLKPCTPSGIIKLFDYYNIDLVGKNAVVIGRSNIVGKPLVNLLINKGATVTCCNSKTNNLKTITSNADIVISAIGKAKFLDYKYFKNGQVIIDVGINFDELGKICGDVNLKSIEENNLDVSITPVPGGVGPLTVAMLMENVLNAYKKRGHKDEDTTNR